MNGGGMNGTPDIVVLGLSLSSSWGNGHATTYRALLRGLAALGQRVLFLERDVPWYAEHRDLPRSDDCELAFYNSLEQLASRYGDAVETAGTVIVGSYVLDGIAVLDLVLATARGTRVFYDIDTPVTLASLARGDVAYLAPRQIPKLDLYLSFTGGPTLHHLATRYGAIRPRVFYCAVDESRYRPTGATLAWELGYLGTYSPDRQPALERLLLAPARRLPHCRFVVAGPQYPDTIDWPANVERIEHLPPDAHADFYAAQLFTLNITRADMIAAGWSPSVRLFEAAACGTPIISDRWTGLTELLPDGEAILIADDSQAVVDALTTVDLPTRQAMAANARAIVLRAHTGTARARDLLRHLAEARDAPGFPTPFTVQPVGAGRTQGEMLP
jgi:spore maturation protein CgeB